ncbi:MAG: threonine ammonia-lyase [Planctomycetes bacterium]|nr:threonine ammonia-lyase [Planctomycetota bacterium]
MTLDLAASLARIALAAREIRPYLRHTPTVYSYTFSESAGCAVHLKLENLQRTGSFKLRGALWRILALSPAERARGLVAASAGNHAQGVALAARLLGCTATIVMPEATALNKIRRTEGYGAEVLLHGANWDASQAKAEELQRARGATLIHPFDDELVIEGQGTVGLELLADLPEVETVVVPIGGGGLAAGVALALKATRPAVRLIGVQAEGAAAMAESFARKERVVHARPTTLAEGIRVGAPGKRTFELVRALLDEVVTVSDEEITDAVVATLEKSKVVAETAGVVGMAALAAKKFAVRPDEVVCAIVSGGNIDLNQLARLIESGLAAQGATHLVAVRVPDVPGQLYAVLGILAETRCNILDVQHYRAGWQVPVGFVDVEVLIETRHPGQGAEVEAVLAGRGFRVVSG